MKENQHYETDTTEFNLGWKSKKKIFQSDISTEISRMTTTQADRVGEHFFMHKKL